MECGVLSVKLCELDKKIGQVHSRIQLIELADQEQIEEEVKVLRKECLENEAVLYDKLKFSKAGAVLRLADAYSEIEQIIKRTRDSFECPDSGVGNSDAFMEEKILLAEYSLDFALQAANRALLAAMESMEEQTTQQEKEVKRHD